MYSTFLNTRLMFKSGNALLEAIVGIQIDDTTCAATLDFANKEKKDSKQFPSNGKEIDGERKTKFNGVQLTRIRYMGQ